MNKPVKLDFFDVVSVPKAKSLMNASTFKVMEVASYLAKQLYSNENSQPYQEWSNTGVECEVLKMDGNGWKKGKVRISLEFIPDEEEEEEILEANLEEESIPPKLPESPLDDLRTQLKID
jgi:hypothetical protein